MPRTSTVTHPAVLPHALRDACGKRLSADGVRRLAPGRGKVLVRLRASVVNGAHLALVAGGAGQPAPTLQRVGAAGTVIATGDGVTRFRVGDEVFGQFDVPTDARTSCVRADADAPHVELRPAKLDPVEAAALAEAGLIAKTIVRAADVRRGQTVMVIGATAGPGTALLELLADAGARIIATATADEEERVRGLGATETIRCAIIDTIDVLARHPEVELIVDLTTFGEPYFAKAHPLWRAGTLITTLPDVDANAGTGEPGLPRMPLAAQPGDLAELAQRALDRRQPTVVALPRAGLRRPGRISRPRGGEVRA
jgi:NADPH:quinone reductase